MQKIIECVPNFSDGRRPEVCNAIAGAIRAVPGTHVLDVSADPDHNRTVITFVGTPSAVVEGAFQAIAKAAEHINLHEHEGEHPRIGATDVCPFIPVRGVTVDECIELARTVGRRVGHELGIAVYLYGAAASRPDRVKLSQIRRGEFELWHKEIGSNPDREPDFGPAVAKPWGATVIGVRPFLIAYNIFLNSDDVEVARAIARAVRFSSGGLRHVQAMGFLVEGQAQVSMNLTDFNHTPIHRVQELVRREAAHYGLTIARAELIGLAPQKAFLEAATWYLQVDNMEDDQILETRLAQVQEADFTPHNLLAATAAGTPAPGGGSAAAASAALAAALTEMVANLTVGRTKYAAFEAEARAILDEASRLRQELAAAVTVDAAAFNQLMSVWRDSSLSDQARQAAIQRATRRAAEVPLSVARLSRRVAQMAAKVTSEGNANAVTDAAAGALLARSAAEIAALNVRINLKELLDRAVATSWLEELGEILQEVERLAHEAAETAARRAGF
jgi:glutamate formiminotransferase / formiminotetrahydrofolate cyclodeaminase